MVHEVSVVGGGMHVAALHEARGSLLASRTIPTSKPSEAYVLQQTLASFQPGRILVLALLPDGSRYLAPAELLLRKMGCRLVSRVGVGEMWAAIISRNVTQEALVPRAPIALDVRSSYDVILAPVSRSLILGVSLMTHQATMCSWHRRSEMAQQRFFCETYDGFPELCRCHHPLTPAGAHATAPRLPWKETIPCVVAASKHPFHLYRVLLQLVQMPGGAQTPLFIRMEGECPAIEALAQLFNIPFSKYLTTLEDRSVGSVTQLIAVVTQSAVNDTFTRYPHADKVIFMEDDVLLSPDFLWYFQQTAQLMNEDPTILAVSAHNTQSFAGLGSDPRKLLRGVTPPMWGWMATRRLIQDWVPELWGDWDYWVMARARSQGMDIVFPELSRSLHAGSSGTHIDGFHQAMVFNRQSANLQNLTNLINLSGLVRKSFSAALRNDVITATPLTLTSPGDCGPGLIPAGQDGPFIMFLSDNREHYAVLQCFGMYTEDLRGDFEQVHQLRVAGKKLYLVDCPESPHWLGGRPVSPKTAMEQEKRIRREIANSNERRRMQSINAGFASLKTLLPHHEGEKLSKAAILQQTAEYIYQLEQEKTRLLSQNCQLKRLLNQQQHHADVEGSPTGGESPCDDGGSSGGEAVVVSTQVDGGAATEELRREMIDLRMQLDRERRHRMTLEEHIRSLEAQTYPERIKEISHQACKTELVEQKVDSLAVPVSASVLGSATGVLGAGLGSVTGQVTNVVEVSTTPRPASTTTIKTEPPSPPPQIHQHQYHPMGSATTVTTTTPVAAIATTTSVASMATTTTSIGHPPPRQPATAVLSRQSLNSNPHNQIPATVVSASPATTIVTVVPSSKGGVDALPSVFEALTASGRFGAKVEVEPAPRVPSPEATIEYVDDTKNHTVYIVNSTNAACQKSLDTICEAIRHLEGDHMFQTEEQHPRIEEEVITEETLTIEDHTGEQVTLGGQVPVTVGGQVTLGSEQVTLSGEDEPITLHMVGEPQEVPLELTTHRPIQQSSSLSNTSRLPQQSTISVTANSRLGQHPAHLTTSTRLPQQSPNHITTSIEAVPVCSISTTTSSSHPSSSNLLQATRPGVIVVKHP